MNNAHLHILLPESLHKKLLSQSRQKKVSVSELVRQAVVNAYFSPQEEVAAKRQRFFDQVAETREKYGPVEDLNYSALIEDGRHI